MRSFIFFTFLFLSVASVAGEPIKDKDALENELINCLKGKPKEAKCITNVLGKNLLPRRKSAITVAAEMDEVIAKWLGKESVYSVHFIKSIKAGDITERRDYVIEDSAGNFMLMNVVTINHLGNIYIYKFHVSSLDEDLEEALNPKN